MWFRLSCVVALTLAPLSLATAGPSEDAHADAPEAERQASESTKIKLKRDLATVNGTPLCKVEDDPARRGSFYLTDLEGERLVYLRWIYEADHNYFEGYRASDLDTLLFDTEAYIGYKKWLVRTLHDAGVLSTDGLDDTLLTEFAAKTGTEMTRLRQERAGHHAP